MSNKYLKEISTENVMDLIYCVFSFKLFYEYSVNFLKVLIIDSLELKKVSSDVLKKIDETILLTTAYFYFDYLYWTLSNSHYEINRENLLLPEKVYGLSDLHKITESIILSYYEASGKKSNVKKIQKTFFEKMKFSKIIPFLRKNHLPPLASNDIYKDYDIKKIENKVDIDYYMYRKNDLISKLPIQSILHGYQLNRIKDVNIIAVELKYRIITKYNNYLTKRCKDTHSIFYLLVYYKLCGFIDEYGDCIIDIPNITDKKLLTLYNEATDLLGTPLSVPHNKPYFGLFPDIEQYFGSKGSFYDIEPESGIYSIQFPLSYFFIKNTIEKVEKWLNSKNLTFILWFIENPIFDINKLSLESSTYYKDTYKLKGKYSTAYILSSE